MGTQLFEIQAHFCSIISASPITNTRVTSCESNHIQKTSKQSQESRNSCWMHTWSWVDNKILLNEVVLTKQLCTNRSMLEKK